MTSKLISSFFLNRAFISAGWEPIKNLSIGATANFSFGTLVTSSDNIPKATHLPFLINSKEDKIILTSHLARANSLT